jgi:hypothetical protein
MLDEAPAGRKLHGVEKIPRSEVGWELMMLKLMGERATSHPSFWEPFVLVGDGGTP